MKIWIDLSDLLGWPLNHLTGIQRVIINVATALKDIHPETHFFIYKTDTDSFHTVNANTVAHAKNSEVKKVEVLDEKVTFQSSDVLLLLGGTWVTKNLIQKITALKEEVHFKVVHCIYDVTPIKVPHVHWDKTRIVMSEWIPKISACTDHFVTISNYSKSDILDVFQEMNLPEKPIHVLRLGDEIEKDGYSEEEPQSAVAIKKNDFILCAGSFEPRKNHFLLYQAWKLLYSKHKERTPQLIIVGSKGWLTEDFKSVILRDPELKEKIVWLSNIPEAQLNWLYRNCKFSVYPSIYEGWGLPIAESLTRHKPCIASNATSMPEIVGPLIDYFNPYNPIECRDLIEKYYFDETYLAKKIKEVENTFRPTTWISTAKQCLKVIQEA